MEFKIKSITKENLRELFSGLIRLEDNWTDLGEKAWNFENFFKDLSGKWELSIYAQVSNKLVGYIIGSYEENCAKLNKIVVDKSYRRNGIASKLWDEFLIRCRKRGIKKVIFRALVDNEPAINFYRKKNCLFVGYTKGEDGFIRADIKYVFKSDWIKHSKPSIDSFDIFSVNKALINGDLASGKIVKEFKDSLCDYVRRDFGIATNSGTSALHLALLGLGIKSGDEVIVSSYVCSSVLSAIKYCEATPIIVDINEDDFNISLEETKKMITSKTKAIIVTHMFGDSMKDIEGFLELNVPIIEDCAMSVGGLLNNKKVGSFGKVSIFSFYATKMMTSGVGGMVLTSDMEVYKKILDLTDYDNRDFWIKSYNYKMSDLQAAIGLNQLKKLDKFVKKRKELALRYDDLLEKSEFLIKRKNSVFFRYLVDCLDVDYFTSMMQKRGIDAKKPIYKPLHNYLGLSDENFKNTVKAYRTKVSIPIYPDLSNEDIEDIVSVIINLKSEEKFL